MGVSKKSIEIENKFTLLNCVCVGVRVAQTTAGQAEAQGHEHAVRTARAALDRRELADRHSRGDGVLRARSAHAHAAQDHQREDGQDAARDRRTRRARRPAHARDEPQQGYIRMRIHVSLAVFVDVV